VFTDPHHVDEERDPNLNPHFSGIGKTDLDPHLSEKGIGNPVYDSRGQCKLKNCNTYGFGPVHEPDLEIADSDTTLKLDTVKNCS
jgi:hypothetical protein